MRTGIPFQNGRDMRRNLKGRPHGVKSIPDILRKLGAEPDAEGHKLEKVMRKVYALALKGEAWAVHFIADRTEGKALQRIGGIDEPRPLFVQFVSADEPEVKPTKIKQLPEA